jgi:hypothetical protein
MRGPQCRKRPADHTAFVWLTRARNRKKGEVATPYYAGLRGRFTLAGGVHRAVCHHFAPSCDGQRPRDSARSLATP